MPTGWLRQIATPMSVFMVAAACDPAPAHSTLASLHHPAFLGHAVTCNAAPFVDTMPPRTELGSMLDCLGWQEWVDERDLQLDVVRYGTIVKMTKLQAGMPVATGVIEGACRYFEEVPRIRLPGGGVRGDGQALRRAKSRGRCPQKRRKAPLNALRLLKPSSTATSVTRRRDPASSSMARSMRAV